MPEPILEDDPTENLEEWLRALRREVVQLRKDVTRTRDVLVTGLARLISLLTQPQYPTVKLTVTMFSQGDPMAPSAVFSIDDTTGEAKWAWDDDHDDTDAAAPLDASGAPVTVTPSSDNDAVATIGAPDQATKSAPVTPVAEGSFNLVVAVTDSAGAPAVWPADAPGGVAGQPITVAPISGSVGPGPAGGLAATLNP